MRMRSQSATSLGAHWMRSDKEVTFDGLTKNYTQCTIDFHLPEALEAPVLIYYRLTNFMQNHRKYAHSRSGDQLKGVAASLSSVRSSCNVVATEVEPVTGREMAVYPCGAIANSIFNDTFESPQLLPDATGPGSNSRQVSYTMSNKGIAPLLDMALYAPSSYSVADEPGDNGTIIVPPPNWAERYPRGYHSGNMFDPAGDEAFMVWMHNSASPDFTKLAMRNDQDSMPEGFYRLNIMSRKLKDSAIPKDATGLIKELNRLSHTRKRRQKVHSYYESSYFQPKEALGRRVHHRRGPINPICHRHSVVTFP